MPSDKAPSNESKEKILETMRVLEREIDRLEGQYKKAKDGKDDVGVTYFVNEASTLRDKMHVLYAKLAVIIEKMST